jgi:flavodoxin
MKALVFYQSRTGTTKKYAEEIAGYLHEQGIDTKSIWIQKYKGETIEGIDYLFLGCWTHGLFVFLQHPDKEWVAFARKLQVAGNPKTCLFTTYKILTGSMFRKMKKHLSPNVLLSGPKLKSKDGRLSQMDKAELDTFINRKNHSIQ